MRGHNAERGAAQSSSTGTLIATVAPKSSPRLDEDAAQLLAEAARNLDAAQSILARGVLEDEHSDLVLGSSTALIYISTAIKKLSWATHFDLDRVA